MKKFYAMLLCVIVAASSMSVSAKKWRVITDVGLGYAIFGDYQEVEVWGPENGFCVQPLISAGYQLNKLFLGGGLGINHILTKHAATSFPLFAHIRYDFFKNDPKTFSPFISYRVGYSLQGADYGTAGLFINPSVGFRKGISSTVGLNISISYSCGKAEYAILRGDHFHSWDEYDTINFGTISINIGIDF